VTVDNDRLDKLIIRIARGCEKHIHELFSIFGVKEYDKNGYGFSIFLVDHVAQQILLVGNISAHLVYARVAATLIEAEYKPKKYWGLVYEDFVDGLKTILFEYKRFKE
jgi:hypothetical protein